MTLKELLGDKFHDGMTYEEVEKALEGKSLADLSTGKYVDVDKYNNAVNELNTNKKTHEEEVAKYKDYEDLVKYKADNEAKIAENTLRGKFKEAGFKDEFLDFALYQVNSGKIANDENLVDNAKKFLEENPNYGSIANPTPNPSISTKIGDDTGSTSSLPKQIISQPWNANRS